MKYSWALTIFLLVQGTKVAALTVSDVRVSVTDDSAAAAREKALEEAHSLAFKKLIKENFPEASFSLPPQDKLVNMVSDFSIDREKTSPLSYSASLTFKFDDLQVQAWLQQNQTPPLQSTTSSKSLKEEAKPFKIKATYESFSQWQQIKKSFERLSGMQKMVVLSLTPKNAKIEILYLGDNNQFQQHFRSEKISVSPEGENWILSPSTSLSTANTVY